VDDDNLRRDATAISPCCTASHFSAADALAQTQRALSRQALPSQETALAAAYRLGLASEVGVAFQEPCGLVRVIERVCINHKAVHTHSRIFVSVRRLNRTYRHRRDL
jgi:hypothetical protein